jgi:spore coat protein U-like protein
MTNRWICTAAALAALLCAGSVQATINCSLSATNVYPIYSTSPPRKDVDAVGAITLSCSRAAGDPATLYYSLSINNGLANRTAKWQTGTQILDYEVYSDSRHKNAWPSATPGITGSFNFSGLTANFTRPYYFRVHKSNSGQPAGLYDDTLTITALTNTAFSMTTPPPSTWTTTLTPVISIVSECRISTAPGQLTLNYPSFSPASVTGSSSFAVSCTSGTPYTIALDATGGTALGTSYTLALSAASGTGNALPQTHTVTATMPANQSGICAMGTCNATQTRTVTITY